MPILQVMASTYPLDDPSTKRPRLRFAGKCVACGSGLPRGAWPLYDQGAKQVRCLACPGAAAELAVDEGIAGGSAHREFERRKAARETRVKGRVGNLLGGVILALTDEPQSTRMDGPTRSARSIASPGRASRVWAPRAPSTTAAA